MIYLGIIGNILITEIMKHSSCVVMEQGEVGRTFEAVRRLKESCACSTRKVKEKEGGHQKGVNFKFIRFGKY